MRQRFLENSSLEIGNIGYICFKATGTKLQMLLSMACKIKVSIASLSYIFQRTRKKNKKMFDKNNEGKRKNRIDLFKQD